MKKLTAAQITAISKGHGLLNDAQWLACVRYLYAAVHDSDPPNADGWNALIQFMKSFCDWAFTQAQQKYGAVAQECLQQASCQNMEPEYVHVLKKKKCIFSHRTTPRLYTIEGGKQATSQRYHRRFYLWKHHPQTGLMCPHHSDYYVYESHFSHLIESIYGIGHLTSLLREEAIKLDKETKEEDIRISEELWCTHDFWKVIRKQMNSMLEAAWVYLDLNSKLT